MGENSVETTVTMSAGGGTIDLERKMKWAFKERFLKEREGTVG